MASPVICVVSDLHSSIYLFNHRLVSDTLSSYSVLKNIQLGQLSIITTAGQTHVFGSSASYSEGLGQERKCSSRAVLRVLNDVFWIRLCCMGDLGFSEAYMFGEVECPNLIETFKVSKYSSLR